MPTIEETIISPLQQRAIDYCDKKQMPKIGRQIAVIAYMHGAQDERERCKEKLLDWACRCYCTGENYKKCGITDCKNSIVLGIRKAMEGGKS